jgi:hypothetical protein
MECGVIFAPGELAGPREGLAKPVLVGFAEIFAPLLVQKVSYRVKIAYRQRPKRL